MAPRRVCTVADSFAKMENALAKAAEKLRFAIGARLERRCHCVVCAELVPHDCER